MNMKPSEIWDAICEERPWLFPLPVCSPNPHCRYCGWAQTFKADEAGNVTLSSIHSPACRMNMRPDMMEPLDITRLTGTLRMDG